MHKIDNLKPLLSVIKHTIIRGDAYGSTLL